jgi:hypothetical protein
MRFGTFLPRLSLRVVAHPEALLPETEMPKEPSIEYEQGRMGYTEGLTQLDNPYAGNRFDGSWNEWHRGWNEGQQKDQTENAE